MKNPAKLIEIDRQHLLHPLHLSAEYDSALIFTAGKGIRLQATDGRTYIDGLSGLWNVLLGHGVPELAAAAHQQMNELAYCSNYSGAANLRAIELAHELAGFAYPNLNMTFFTSGGGEANEAAFKTARYYWKRKGKPEKVKFIARDNGYHGVTLAAMSATGIPAYWSMFEPRVPGFTHIPAPYPFRFKGQLEPGETVGQAAARALEEAILKEGSETVAAFIAEPVNGAGGVIVPPDDYFPLVREICDRYEVLLISDEVITGFGRTGKWFGLQHWGIVPDIMSFAKGVTSGYLPLGGIQISNEIRETIQAAGPAERWMHAFTYSGHPTCCAVGLANLSLLKSSGVVENARGRGKRLGDGLNDLYRFPQVGDVRGIGLMWGIEFVADRASKAPAGIGPKVRLACQERGLFTRIMGDILILAPPLIITDAEVDEILDIVAEAIRAVTG